MFQCARWLIPTDAGEVFSTDSRTSCGRAARPAARIARRAKVPSRPIDPQRDVGGVGNPRNAASRSAGRAQVAR